jgi:N-acetylmuramoyl-L-alanine amidase
MVPCAEEVAYYSPPQNRLIASVPAGSSSTSDAVSEPNEASRGADTVDEEHVIVRGESLSQIAFRYGTTVQTLRALNHIGNPRLVRPGQTIKLPTE